MKRIILANQNKHCFWKAKTVLFDLVIVIMQPFFAFPCIILHRFVAFLLLNNLVLCQ